MALEGTLIYGSPSSTTSIYKRISDSTWNSGTDAAAVRTGASNDVYRYQQSVLGVDRKDSGSLVADKYLIRQQMTPIIGSYEDSGQANGTYQGHVSPGVYMQAGYGLGQISQTLNETGSGASVWGIYSDYADTNDSRLKANELHFVSGDVGVHMIAGGTATVEAWKYAEQTGRILSRGVAYGSQILEKVVGSSHFTHVPDIAFDVNASGGAPNITDSTEWLKIVARNSGYTPSSHLRATNMGQYFVLDDTEGFGGDGSCRIANTGLRSGGDDDYGNWYRGYRTGGCKMILRTGEYYVHQTDIGSFPYQTQTTIKSNKVTFKNIWGSNEQYNYVKNKYTGNSSRHINGSPYGTGQDSRWGHPGFSQSHRGRRGWVCKTLWSGEINTSGSYTNVSDYIPGSDRTVSELLADKACLPSDYWKTELGLGGSPTDAPVADTNSLDGTNAWAFAGTNQPAWIMVVHGNSTTEATTYTMTQHVILQPPAWASMEESEPLYPLAAENSITTNSARFHYSDYEANYRIQIRRTDGYVACIGYTVLRKIVGFWPTG